MAKTGTLRTRGRMYRRKMWPARTVKTAASERFFGCLGSSNCETISWVCGTVKTETNLLAWVTHSVCWQPRAFVWLLRGIRSLDRTYWFHLAFCQRSSVFFPSRPLPLCPASWHQWHSLSTERYFFPAGRQPLRVRGICSSSAFVRTLKLATNFTKRRAMADIKLMIWFDR